MKIFQFILYNISYKTSTGPTPLRIRFDKIDGVIISHEGKIKHFILFDYELFNKFWDKIKYLISKKSVITNRINHKFWKIRIESYNFLPVKKMLTFHNFIKLIKSVVNKNKNKYHYNKYLEKGLHKDKRMFVYYICYILKELTFLMELMWIKQMHQKSVIFFIICIS